MKIDGTAERIKLEHGAGGALSRWLTEELIFPYFKNKSYPDLSDSACVSSQGEVLITTDSYVVDPPFFPGGDIGRLSVFGTCNDLAVCGGKPLYVTLGLIIEEGFSIDELKSVLSSVNTAAREADVKVITGDTKVVPSGKGGGIYINTSGYGQKIFPYSISPHNIQKGDFVIVTGSIGAHGITVLAARESLRIASELRSDTAFLFPLCCELFSLGPELRFLRDATRGGVASVLNETVSDTDLSLEVRESCFPLDDKIAAAADILGLDPLEIANEGVFIAIVSKTASALALKKLRSHRLGKRAEIVGEVTGTQPATTRSGKVLIETSIGGKRILDYPRNLLLPRIC